MNMKNFICSWLYVIALYTYCILCLINCSDNTPEITKSSSGITKATVHVNVGSDGLTSEQRNIRDRLIEDNKPGAIKHLYVISAYSGQVIIYSTVRGKVTSSGKRLTPTTVSGEYEGTYHYGGFLLDIGGTSVYTNEVLQDDGTYGNSSSDYLYWWDAKGNYHQHYIQGGQIIHISDQPIGVKSITINMEVPQQEEPPIKEFPKGKK
jgi:hypothetical protein